jgi:hypothetical protein
LRRVFRVELDHQAAKVNIFKVVGDLQNYTNTLAASAKFDFVNDRWYRIRIQFANPRLRLFIDGQSIGDGDIGDRTSEPINSMAFGVFGASASFDSLTIVKP